MITRLHIGCGKRDFGKNWIHIDGGNFEHLHSHDVTKLPFEDNSVDLIYACHLIAYFDRKEIVDILNEWKRVLRSGGTLRLAIPDFEQMSMLYQTGKIGLSDILGPLYGKWDMGGQSIYHKTVYDFFELHKLLSEFEFRNIKRYEWWGTEHAKEDDHSQAFLNPKGDKVHGTLISLNVECVK